MWAWVFLGIYLASTLINGAFLLRTSPETIVERGRPGEMKDWDKVFGVLWSLAQFLMLPLVAGLDARFTWTRDLGVAWHIGGAVVFILGLGLFGWANDYQRVLLNGCPHSDRPRPHGVPYGPYRHVRHPGYVGAVFQSLGIPLLLGSLWSLIPGFIAAILIVVRTSLRIARFKPSCPAIVTSRGKFDIV